MRVGAIPGSSRMDGAVAQPLRRMLGLLALWHRRASSRTALRDLPPEQLRDIGVTEMDAAREATRPFWEG